MFFSPLEQFDVSFFLLEKVYILNSFLIILFIFFSFILIYFFFKLKLIPTSIQYFFEIFYKFILETLVQQSGINALFFFPFVFSIFFFILISNLLGMLSFGFTITGHLSLTLYLALSFNLGFFFLGIFLNGYKFFYLFIPKGTPLFLLPLIILIEVISYLIRTLSLSIRLFANMMAGHCLLFVISSFMFSFINSFGVLSFGFIIIIYSCIFFLEFAIAFLQAYVFMILLCIYLNDALHPVH
jgi:F-type H+-transporting ATPase subunit a